MESIASIGFYSNFIASTLNNFIEYFLNEVESLLYKGLTKTYHNIEENKPVLKGRLVFNKHITKNIINKERFFTNHQVYDYENILNQILLEAISILKSTNIRPSFSDKINKILLLFPEIKQCRITYKTFETIKYNRKTERYRAAISLAQLIILNYCPDIKVGRNNVLALLFNMYDLWQEFIYKMLLKDQEKENYTVKYEYQNSMKYWSSTQMRDKSIRPDFIIEKEKQTYVLDTKWKIINDKGPSDSDLHQMFVYNHHVSANRSMLLYPDIGNHVVIIKGSYNLPIYNEDGNIKTEHHCQLGFVKPFIEDEDGQIRPNTSVSKEIMDMLTT
ncbi:MAG: hypothetical protein HN600_06045 [Bacteroidetes bacterium]|nr:hypothetical protein [Bacteroidota bacterium]